MHTPLLCIVDIDGTLADSSHRNHLIEGENPDWKAFIAPENVAKDTLVPGAFEALNKLSRQNAQFVFLTGRNEGLREVTKQWLFEKLSPPGSTYSHWGNSYAPLPFATNENVTTNASGVVFHSTCFTFCKPLVMRPINNEENATVYKERHLLEYFVGLRPTIMMCFDDDAYMHPIYEKYGGIVFKAPECWTSLYPVAKDLPPETPWRK